MKPPTPHADQLIAALPADVAPHVRPTSRLDYHAKRALTEQQWTIPQLATEATRNLDNAANIGAIIDERIRVAATVPPPKTQHRGTGHVRTHFGCCEDGWLYDETSDPPRVTKCPGNGPMGATT